MKTNEEIKQEIEALKAIRPNVRPYSIFGDDNLAQLDAQVAVLSGCMDEDDIYDEYDHADVDGNVLESALHAWQWVCDEAEDDSLAEGWPLNKEKK